MNTAVIVPTYNERENISDLLTQLLALPESLYMIVVDDNSPDGTGEIAERIAQESGRVRVIHRAGKLGAGHGVYRGLSGGAAKRL